MCTTPQALLANFMVDVGGYGVLGLFVAHNLWFQPTWMAYAVGAVRPSPLPLASPSSTPLPLASPSAHLNGLRYRPLALPLASPYKPPSL